jgi:hypothetical protein
LITDNSLLAYEIIHHIKHNKNKINGLVGIKLDMAKAYDRLEWSFIEQTLLIMGFPPRLVQTIMTCVSTVSFSILVNGQPSQSFNPHREIRQGDPLSPYLFIICADVFSSMITSKQSQSLFHGIAIAQNAPKVTHLFFADDSIIFCKANKEEVTHLKAVFDDYQRISGQKINLDNSEMMFSPCMHQHIKLEFQAMLPFTITNSIDKYLGLPTHIGHSKRAAFNFIMDRIRKKLKGWKERRLSFAGRGILISAVIQALPTYLMSCFQLPKGICEQIEQAMCRFWWGGTDRHHKIHWKAKSAIFRSKLAGGLGFRDMHLFNKAMLAKQVWRLQTEPNSLISQCLKAKYYPTTDIILSQQSRNTSYAWQSLHQTVDMIKNGSCWKVGNGQDINIWDDNWVIWQNGYKILTPHTGQNVAKVCDIIDNSPKNWNTTIINQNFLPFESSLIHQIPLIKESIEDQLICPHSKEGNYTVKSGYNLLKHWQKSTSPNSSSYNSQNNIWKKLWNLHTIPRHKMLLWRIIQRAIPVRSNLNKRGVPCNTLCPRCLLKEETIEHVFMHCQHASKIWFGSKLGIKFDHSHTNFPEWLTYAINSLKNEDLIYMAAVVYGIWYARN